MKISTKIITVIILFFLLQACRASRISKPGGSSIVKEVPVATSKNISKSNYLIPARDINTKNISADAVVDFAETLIGIKYKYGSAIKENGFDCSGFITYVFNHYNISVPRSSIDFTNAGKPVSLDKSKRGDIVLFTGTDTTGWIVGHMGIITQNNHGEIKFIHSSSGKSIGVIVSTMSKYYATRFVKAIRVFDR